MRSWAFWTLPPALRGSSGLISTCSGCFWIITPRSWRYNPYSPEVGGEAAFPGPHDGVDSFATFIIGQADHRHVGDGRVVEQKVLDLLGADVLAVAHDEVLEAAGHHHVTVLLEVAEVAGSEPALGVKCGMVELGVDVALEQVGSPRISRHTASNS